MVGAATFKLFLTDACLALDPVLGVPSTMCPEQQIVTLLPPSPAWPFLLKTPWDSVANTSPGDGCQHIPLTPAETLSLTLLLLSYNLRVLPFSHTSLGSL